MATAGMAARTAKSFTETAAESVSPAAAPASSECRSSAWASSANDTSASAIEGMSAAIREDSTANEGAARSMTPAPNPARDRPKSGRATTLRRRRPARRRGRARASPPLSCRVAPSRAAGAHRNRAAATRTRPHRDVRRGRAHLRLQGRRPRRSSLRRPVLVRRAARQRRGGRRVRRPRGVAEGSRGSGADRDHVAAGRVVLPVGRDPDSVQRVLGRREVDVVSDACRGERDHLQDAFGRAGRPHSTSSPWNSVR